MEYRDPTLEDLQKHRDLIVEARISNRLDGPTFRELLNSVNTMINTMIGVAEYGMLGDGE
ncbi:MAG TPA: hypothetical protein VN861_14710 [Candidatus Acidoferrales bacterium]|nr:hypothetical protein [Candidatus Acidoferrales bacterium]